MKINVKKTLKSHVFLTFPNKQNNKACDLNFFLTLFVKNHCCYMQICVFADLASFFFFFFIWETFSVDPPVHKSGPHPLKRSGYKVFAWNAAQIELWVFCRVRPHWYECVKWMAKQLWTFLDFVILVDFLAENDTFKHGIFKICSRQSAMCKMTAQSGRQFFISIVFCK